MKYLTFIVAAAICAAIGCTGSSGASGGDAYAGRYAIVVDAETAADAQWSQVVEALKLKRSAEVFEYKSVAQIEKVLPSLRDFSPRYVCFVSRPGKGLRPLVVSAAQLVRKLDDDPFADAIWGVLTGYEAADALRAISLDKPLEIRRIATSQGNAKTLDDWDGGFASSETNPSNFWIKTSSKAQTQAVEVEGDDIAAPMADAFNNIPIDLFMTSGHASERDWQVIYNKNLAYLKHKNGALEFFTVNGEKWRPIEAPAPKIYMGNGNCLIGNIDKRDCMATSLMHSAGVAQMIGYTVSSFYGYMGWGVKNLLMTGAYSLAESYFLCNQMLLADAIATDPNVAAAKINPSNDFDTMRYIHTMYSLGYSDTETGLLWDRDTMAFYGDPAWRAALPKDKAEIEIDISSDAVRVKFNRERKYSGKVSKGNPSYLGIIFNESLPAGTFITDKRSGEKIPGAIVGDMFALVPMKGKIEKGAVLEYRIVRPAMPPPNSK